MRALLALAAAMLIRPAFAEEPVLLYAAGAFDR